jgi:DNA-binding phage protein
MATFHPLVSKGRRLVELTRHDWGTVAKNAGVSTSWLYKFAQGNIPNPTLRSVQSVIDACELILAKSKSKAARNGSNLEPAQ